MMNKREKVGMVRTVETRVLLLNDWELFLGFRLGFAALMSLGQAVSQAVSESAKNCKKHDTFSIL